MEYFGRLGVSDWKDRKLSSIFFSGMVLDFFVERKIPMSSIAMFEEIPQNELALNIHRIRLIPTKMGNVFLI